ncbi:hypothetical protein [Nostoc sp.]|uniref:hypothetical protein n=1 Tax=Nostoc sp. TaxID=1180 RepID=UPI002FF51E4B
MSFLSLPEAAPTRVDAIEATGVRFLIVRYFLPSGMRPINLIPALLLSISQNSVKQY